MKTKRIALIVLSAAALITCGTVPLVEYLKFLSDQALASQDSIQEDGSSSNEQQQKKRLTDMNISLKEGFSYYKNRKASPKFEDFDVNGVYNDGSNSPMEKEKVSLSYGDDFFLNGGKIVFSSGSVTKEITVELTDLKKVSLTISSLPFKTVYEKNETFDEEALKVEVLYNDGSKESVAKQDASNPNGYQIITSEFSEPTEAHEVKIVYGEGDEKIETAFSVKVVTSLANDELKSVYVEPVTLSEGDSLSSLSSNCRVIGVYESGNKKVLNDDEYYFSSLNGTAELGEKYDISVILNDSGLKAPVSITTRKKIEAESATLPENTYYPHVGAHLGVTYVGGFNPLKGKEGENWMAFSVSSENYSEGKLTLRISNGFARNIQGENAWTQYHAALPLDLSDVATITLNGKELEGDFWLPGYVTTKEEEVGYYDEIFGHYVNLTIDDIALHRGDDNILKIQWKTSESGKQNLWNETPSCNIDYFVYEVESKELNASDVVSLESSSFPSRISSLDLEEKNFIVNAKMNDGSLREVSRDDILISVSNVFAPTEFGVGYHDVTVYLAKNKSIFFVQKNVLVYDETSADYMDANGGAKGTIQDSYGVKHKVWTDLSDGNTLNVSFAVHQKQSIDVFLDLINLYKQNDISLDVPLNKVMDVTLDDNALAINDSVILKGKMSSSQKEQGNIYPSSVKLITLNDLERGEHSLKITLKSENEYTPSLALEKVRFESSKYDVKDVKSIAFEKESISVEGNTYCSEVILPRVIATLNNEEKVVLDDADLIFSYSEDSIIYAPLSEERIEAKLGELKATLTIHVSGKMEAENRTGLSYNVNTEKNEAGDVYVSGFTNKNTWRSTFDYKFTIKEEGDYKISANLANGYIVKNNEGSYYSKEIALKEFVDFKINGEALTLSDSAKFENSSNSDLWDLYKIFSLLTISDGTHLKKGENSIHFEFKSFHNDLDEDFYWVNQNGVGKDPQSPTFNLDYFLLEKI
ncbi:MAG TPA: hypothetical protein DD384_01740 [Firmicutes bacterium]|nr:hypothetical protein [Bacillota bacterium]